MSHKKNGNPQLEITSEQLLEILDRLKKKTLTEDDYSKLEVIVGSFGKIAEELLEKKVSIERMKRLVFGKNEKSKKKTEQTPVTEETAPAGSSVELPVKKKPKGHGKNGASAYKGATHIHVPHGSLKPGHICPECARGPIYKMNKKGVVLRITGRTPFEATVYDQDLLRCSACQALFKADLPVEAGKEKYDEAATALIALMKYGEGMPFNRLENFQKDLGVPLPASTQYEILRDLCWKLSPIYQMLLYQAAQGNIIHNDDTTVRILELSKELKKANSKRKGTFTTGIVSRNPGQDIALYFSGNNHAGENLAILLKLRQPDLPPPIQMCDALSRNWSEEFITILANCLSHGRRQFVYLLENFPAECRYVIELLGKVYHHDKLAKEAKMTPEKRLAFHQEKSGPLMEDLHKWFAKQFEDKLVEPNSSLGKAIVYMQTHWKKLTLFLSVPGAPLDNNICERTLKLSILNRKNAYYYKTQNGAQVGDILMSIIQTARLSKTNVFNYLVDLQKHGEIVKKDPEKWLPWNYQATLQELIE